MQKNNSQKGLTEKTKMDHHLKYTHDFFSEAQKILDEKTRRYAPEEDPFKGFRTGEFIGVSIPKAILTRMLEKIGRVNNITDGVMDVGSEPLEETLMDIANYSAILSSYLTHKHE